MKNAINSQKYIESRNWNNFAKDDFRNSVINHPQFENALTSNSPTIISELLQKIIRESPDTIAPIN